jgi:S-adenosylmethionine/arginine decarboxylase-like enzyme
MIHHVADLTDCQHSDRAPDELLTAMRGVAARLGCTVRDELAVPFEPAGATCVLVLAESHLTVSTWPECALAHVDLVTCRADTDPATALQPLSTLVPRQAFGSVRAG